MPEPPRDALASPCWVNTTDAFTLYMLIHQPRDDAGMARSVDLFRVDGGNERPKPGDLICTDSLSSAPPLGQGAIASSGPKLGFGGKRLDAAPAAGPVPPNAAKESTGKLQPVVAQVDVYCIHPSACWLVPLPRITVPGEPSDSSLHLGDARKADVPCHVVAFDGSVRLLFDLTKSDRDARARVIFSPASDENALDGDDLFGCLTFIPVRCWTWGCWTGVLAD